MKQTKLCYLEVWHIKTNHHDLNEDDNGNLPHFFDVRQGQERKFLHVGCIARLSTVFAFSMLTHQSRRPRGKGITHLEYMASVGGG